MPPSIDLVPLEAIDADALARDRTSQDPDALQELVSSIAVSGLRMPVEVWQLSEPRGPHRFGLISGYRRLAAFRSLAETALDKAPYAAIPAFVRAPASIADAFVAMVEENAIRAAVSPWEQGMIAVTARDEGVFDTVEAAIDALYAKLSRHKRQRLRAIAHLAEDLAGRLTAPESLSLRQLLRLAAASGRGFGELMRHALDESEQKSPDEQWQLLLPILVESEHPDTVEPKSIYTHYSRRPRRLLKPRSGVTVRRSMTRDGWCLHFTGREATGALMDLVLEEIERMYAP